MHGRIFAGDSRDYSRVIDDKLRRLENPSFSRFQTRFFWSKIIKQMYKAKGRSLGWKRCMLETFSTCTLKRPSIYRIHGLLWEISWKTVSPNISKTTSPSLYITYMYIIHKNMKNKSYYGFETKKGPFSFSIISAPWFGIFEIFKIEQIARMMGYRMQFVWLS